MTRLLVRLFVKNSRDTDDPAVRAAYGNLAGAVGIACNVLLCAAKLTAGLLAGSMSVLADALNNLSDASSSVVTLLGFRLSAKPADKEHPFGHARIEYIAGLGVAVMILLIGIELAKSGFEKILSPEPVEFTALTAAVLCGSVALKLWMTVFNRKLALKLESATLRATSADSRNDAVATTAVLLAAVIEHFTKIQLDGWMALAVAAFILYSGVGILRDTLSPLLGEAPTAELSQYIARKVLSYDGVLGTHDLMVHDYGPGRRFGSVHVEMDASVDVMKSHEIIDTIERDFLENDHMHIIIHFDPIVTGDEAVGTKREWARKLVQSIAPELSIHDFRMVPGPNHTNVIFDVVAPPDFPLPDDVLKQRIGELVQADDPSCTAVVTIDKSYAPIPSDASNTKG